MPVAVGRGPEQRTGRKSAVESSGPRRGLMSALALTLGVTGLAIITTDTAAIAAPHNVSPPSTHIGWTDSATPGKAYNATEDVNLPVGTWLDDDGVSHTSRVYA